jgi:hypothetical protein
MTALRVETAASSAPQREDVMAAAAAAAAVAARRAPPASLRPGPCCAVTLATVLVPAAALSRLEGPQVAADPSIPAAAHGAGIAAVTAVTAMALLPTAAPGGT